MKYLKPKGVTDYMDSAHYVGIRNFLGYEFDTFDIIDDYVTNGILSRCPEIMTGLQPANPHNCTRDQIIGYCSGKSKHIKDIYLQCKKRGFLGLGRAHMNSLDAFPWSCKC